MHNLHGMPAVASAFFSAIFAYFATKEAYGDSLYTIFPGMKNSALMEDEHEMIIGVKVLYTYNEISFYISAVSCN